MDKKVYAEVEKRAAGECEICKAGGNLELHHILRRKVKENQYNCIMLCYEHHRGTYGVHGKYGHLLDMTLKQKLQKTYFKLGYKENEIRELMGGKLYDFSD